MLLMNFQLLIKKNKKNSHQLLLHIMVDKCIIDKETANIRKEEVFFKKKKHMSSMSLIYIVGPFPNS
jgi:hypothetical protein